jgi:1,4-dihydroxy-2-naphthoate octaprenyltransferase
MLAIWEGQWNPWIALWALLTGALLQIIANLANDYGDFLHGAGVGNRVGVSTQNKLVSLNQLKQAILVVCLVTSVCGLLLLKSAHIPGSIFILFVIIGCMAIIAAITYTMGPKPYAYLGLGDLAVMSFFGFVGVLGTAYLHTKAWHTAYMLPALSAGSLAVAVLNLNNIRDQKLDAAVGKKTLVVRMGREAALYYQWVLLGLAIILLVIFTWRYYQRPWQWLFLVIVPRLIQNGWMTKRLAPAQLDLVLQRLVVSQLLFLWLFGVGLVLSKYW